MKRPFYTTHAWAYDLLIDRPVKEHCGFIISQLRRHQIGEGACLLDAGCGTGNYAITLAERGFRLIGVDSSPEQIEVAKNKAQKSGVAVDFMVGDILNLPRQLEVDAILCRGVLNDFTKEATRSSVFSSFTTPLRPGGVLIVDVREWWTTLTRKTKNPVFEKIVTTENGQLTFRSITKLRVETHSMLISETHSMRSAQGQDTSTFEFEMKCWTKEELKFHLENAGFVVLDLFGDYNEARKVGTTDRLVVVAALVEESKAQHGVSVDAEKTRPN